MNDTLHSLLIWPHIVAGGVALLAMWPPIFATKGGKLHRRAGWVYVGSMGVVALTALMLSGLWLISGQSAFVAKGLFFGFLGLLSGNTITHGLRVLRQKKRTLPHTNPLDLGNSTLLAVVGLALVVWGATQSHTLAVVFGILGVVLGGRQLKTLRSTPTSKRFWWFEHMTGMGASCIATTTAFLVVNGQHLPLPGLVVWLTPTVVGTVALVVAGRRYKSRFNPSG